jgi:ABC-type cobalamin transport system ATPase subunit
MRKKVHHGPEEHGDAVPEVSKRRTSGAKQVAEALLKKEEKISEAGHHLFGGPYKRCRCATCMVRKRRMTAIQIRLLDTKPK